MDPSPGGLADLPLSQLLSRLAAATPAPGGGSATALACALAAGLVEMAAGFAPAHPSRAAGSVGPGPVGSVGPGPVGPSSSETGARAAQLRVRALELADAELDCYAPVLESLRLAPDHPHRAERLREALSGASDAPLQIAAVGAELAALAARTAGAGSSQLAGDAIAAALLAEGACRAAAQLVAINLAGAGEDPRVERAGELTRAAARSSRQALATGSALARR